MGLLLEYLPWRGDLTLESAPLCPVDVLILTQLSYLRFQNALGGQTGVTLSKAAPMIEAALPEFGNAQIVADRHQLLRDAAASARFGGLIVMDYAERLDDASDMQFAAVTFALPGGSLAVAYRGTDATLVGWREDFNMSFQCPVPAQSEAVGYLERVAGAHGGKLLLCGHSKGGNLSMYAAARCGAAARARIPDGYTFDGAGLDQETLASDGFAQTSGLIRSYVPQTSIIGRLMGAPEPYTVVHSRASALMQHNTFTWEVLGPGFITLPETNNSSRLIKATLDDFLHDSTPEMRRVLVDTLFGLVETSKAQTIGDLRREWATSAITIFTATRGVDPATRKALAGLASTLFASGAESVKDLLMDVAAAREERKTGLTDGRDKP